MATERDLLIEKLRAVADINTSADVTEASIDRLYEQAIEWQSRRIDIGIPSGIKPLDDLIKGGAKPGQVIFVVARPSHGKSVVGIQWALSSARRNSPALVISFEMPEPEVIGRLIQMAGVRREEEVGVAMFRDLPLYVRESAGWTIHKIEAAVEAACKNNGIGCVVIDYLGRISEHNPKLERWRHLQEVTSRLKQLALKCKIPIICLAQLSRKIDGRESKAVRFEDIKESGSIEEDADVIVAIVRDEVSRITVIKQRDGGQTGCVDVMLHPDKQLFVEAATDREMPTW
jgi:replicative DNA helicase